MKENSDEHVYVCTYIHEQVHTIFYIFVKSQPVPHVVVVIVVFPPLYIHFSSRVRYFLRPRFTFTNIHVAVLFIAQAASTTLPPKMAVSINQPTK